jgi:Tfp pilus assembly protein PilF
MLVEVANGALVEGDPTGALQNLARAELEDSTLPELYHTRALAYHSKHDLKAAIEAASQAVKLKPDYSDANNTLGKILIDVGRYETAIPYLEAASHDPLNRQAYKAWTNLGIVKYRQGDYSKSEAYLNKAIENASNLACVAYYYRGHIRMRQARIVDAIKDYDIATRKLCTGFGDADLALGVAYQRSQQYLKARKTFLEIQKRYPNTKIAEQALNQLKDLP